MDLHLLTRPITAFLLFSALVPALADKAKTTTSPTNPTLYQMTATDIDGKSTPLSKFQGKVALVVNTASECGYTPQYEGLEALYQKYKDKGFVILGFPSNDFGAQEPAPNAEIKKFCEKKYHITFPLFSKAPVKGAQKQPIYQFLTKYQPVEEVSWNFEKFLINQKGEVIGRFKSAVRPTDSELDKKISEALGKS